LSYKIKFSKRKIIPRGKNKKMKNQKGVIAGLAIVILVLTMALAYVILAKKAEAPAVSQNPVPAVEKPASVESGMTAAEVQDLIVSGTPAVVDIYAGWPTYKSDRYDYEIRYPSGMTITEAKKDDFGLSPDSNMTFDQAYAKYTGQVCVNFENKKDSVLISAPANVGYEYVICGRTGMGNDTKIKKYKDKLTIDGKEYSADVNDMTGSTGRTIETVVELSDGTQISFSASNEEYRAGLKKMVESFRKTK
jgi:outer membrane protein assembly factor BamE (lipoprotein component of BamABCDE complex)